MRILGLAACNKFQIGQLYFIVAPMFICKYRVKERAPSPGIMFQCSIDIKIEDLY